jgi:hypothetical protein
MPERLLLPELGRSLRTFGAPRDAAGDAAHDAIFSPLLEARARAELGDVEAALSALRGGVLGTRISARVAQAAAVGEPEPARARARTARATELVEPLVAELATLDALSVAARGGEAGSPAWQGWVAQLRRVFASADDACRALARLLAEPPADARPPRRWFGSR